MGQGDWTEPRCGRRRTRRRRCCLCCQMGVPSWPLAWSRHQPSQQTCSGPPSALESGRPCLAVPLWRFGNYGCPLDTSLFPYTNGGTQAFCLIYVDDIILTRSDNTHLQHLVASLQLEFQLKDLGQLDYFLGIEAHHTKMGLLLTQTKYIEDLLHKANMTTCKSLSTPATPNEKLQATSVESTLDITLYRTIVGALQYLNITRPDIAFSVRKASQYVHSPKRQHSVAVKHILRYLKGTQRYGLLLTSSFNLDIHAYSDANWESNLDDRKSTSGYAIFMGE
ncbi:hypothetical protein GH714_003956 [Hevea brasiliensis]|uniref:Reverse transcriptase Ty1/copia-type domain-containing protein n=1 Tax=Hevea brasiliensis TaxID=3981 RepID=A0A6A6KN95_HEVBR|nr:hypothetical protein GH714_003956 [Hevea brasiliensis]